MFVFDAWVVVVLAIVIALLLAFLIRRKALDIAGAVLKADKRVDKQQVIWGEFAVLLADWKLHGLSDVYTHLAAIDVSGAIAKGVSIRTKAETKGGMLEMLEDNFVLQVAKRAEDEALCKAAAKVIAKEPALLKSINAEVAAAFPPPPANMAKA